MESCTRLDYVLFHLTPTRTRCDLVIYAGKSNEKLAYGLLEPFIAHLKSAEDQISKGGYSVTLRPPLSENTHYFTKGTLQRFVRFVSTPEVLERFVTIEREISQLESSIKSFEASTAGVGTDGNGGGGGNSKIAAVSCKSYGESNDGDDLEQEENSKARLHRVVETRKVVLRKEQAMVYARALAAGFEIDNLNDLLLFSDAFGASRLREACINFRDLCNKKNEDWHWVDEIAAMKSMMSPDMLFTGTSEVVLAGDDNDPSIAGKPNGSADNSMSTSQTLGQMQNPWAKQFPAFLRNFHGPNFQHMPPYGFPGMHAPPPYYPANISWPSDDRDSHDRHGRKTSSKKKTKASEARESESGENEGNTEPGESSTDTDSSFGTSHQKKNGKKSSRKVVIRNINYISSRQDGDKNSDSESNSSDEEVYLDGDSKVVGSSEKYYKSMSRHHKKRNGTNSTKDPSSVNISGDQNGIKGNESWDAFQQLLLYEDSETNVAEAKRLKERNAHAFTSEADAFVVTGKGTGSYEDVAKVSDESFDRSQGYHAATRRGGTLEEFPLTQRSVEKPKSFERVSWPDDAARSVLKTHASDDWFVKKQLDDTVNQGEVGHLGLVDGVYVTSATDQVEKRNKTAVNDNSLMIQGRLSDDYLKGQLCTDISMVSDIIEASFVENRATEEVPQKVSEPQGFYEPDELYMVLDRNTTTDQTVPSWNPEVDFENNAPVNKSAKNPDADASADLNSHKKVADRKRATKASSRVVRSRITGESFRRGKPETTPVPQRSTFGSKTASPKSQLQKDEERRKRMEELLIQRQKRIAERESGSSVTAALISDKLKPQTSAEKTKKPKAVLRSSTIDRLAVAKKTPNSLTPQPMREASKLKDVNVKSSSQKTRKVHVKKINTTKIVPSEEIPENGELTVVRSFVDVKEAKPAERIDSIDESEDIKELRTTSSIINNNELFVEQTTPSDENEDKLVEVHSTISDAVKKKDAELPEKSPSLTEELIVSDDHDEMSIHPVPESPAKHKTASSIIEGNVVASGNIPHSLESTPPETNETILESTPRVRKKWEGPENSLKSIKGFRKLLMFGRRS